MMEFINYKNTNIDRDSFEWYDEKENLHFVVWLECWFTHRDRFNFGEFDDAQEVEAYVKYFPKTGKIQLWYGVIDPVSTYVDDWQQLDLFPEEIAHLTAMIIRAFTILEGCTPQEFAVNHGWMNL